MSKAHLKKFDALAKKYGLKTMNKKDLTKLKDRPDDNSWVIGYYIPEEEVNGFSPRYSRFVAVYKQPTWGLAAYTGDRNDPLTDWLDSGAWEEEFSEKDEDDEVWEEGDPDVKGSMQRDYARAGSIPGSPEHQALQSHGRPKLEKHYIQVPPSAMDTAQDFGVERDEVGKYYFPMYNGKVHMDDLRKTPEEATRFWQYLIRKDGVYEAKRVKLKAVIKEAVRESLFAERENPPTSDTEGVPNLDKIEAKKAELKSLYSTKKYYDHAEHPQYGLEKTEREAVEAKIKTARDELSRLQDPEGYAKKQADQKARVDMISNARSIKPRDVAQLLKKVRAESGKRIGIMDLNSTLKPYFSAYRLNKIEWSDVEKKAMSAFVGSVNEEDYDTARDLGFIKTGANRDNIKNYNPNIGISRYNAYKSKQGGGSNKSYSSKDKMYLFVPFSDKDVAKTEFGAKWDPDRKSWYVVKYYSDASGKEWFYDKHGAKRPIADIPSKWWKDPKKKVSEAKKPKKDPNKARKAARRKYQKTPPSQTIKNKKDKAREKDKRDGRKGISKDDY
jgi:hypothetical protein